MKSASIRCKRFHHQFAVCLVFACALMVLAIGPSSAAAGNNTSTGDAAPAFSTSPWADATRGLYLGVGLGGSSVPTVDRGATALDIRNDGGALALSLGYGFNPVFALELRISGAGHDTSVRTIDAGFAAIEALAVYRWRPHHPFRPYVRAGLGGYGITLDDGIAHTTVSGGGIPFGGGVEYFLGQHVSLGFDITHRVIDYDKITVDTGSTTGAFAVDRNGSQTSSTFTIGVYF